MAHYAKVNNGIVEQVIVAEADFFDNFVDSSPGEWIQTSYNTHAIRINYAAVSVLATTITLLASSTTGFSAYITGASGLTVGQGVTLANNGVLELNAEL